MRDGSKVVRVSYVKKYGEEEPGWLVGYGRFEGNRFVLEGEFTARQVIIRSESYGLVAYQTTPAGEVVDRGWIMARYRHIEYDGRVCVIF